MLLADFATLRAGTTALLSGTTALLSGTTAFTTFTVNTTLLAHTDEGASTPHSSMA